MDYLEWKILISKLAPPPFYKSNSEELGTENTPSNPRRDYCPSLPPRPPGEARWHSWCTACRTSIKSSRPTNLFPDLRFGLP